MQFLVTMQDGRCMQAWSCRSANWRERSAKVLRCPPRWPDPEYLFGAPSVFFGGEFLSHAAGSPGQDERDERDGNRGDHIA